MLRLYLVQLEFSHFATYGCFPLLDLTHQLAEVHPYLIRFQQYCACVYSSLKPSSTSVGPHLCIMFSRFKKGCWFVTKKSFYVDILDIAKTMPKVCECQKWRK